ncbi:LOW QUALITY PROTEIN: GTP-binding protein REM 2-like [Mustelus asterias]
MPLRRRSQRGHLEHRRSSMPLPLRHQSCRGRGLTEQLTVIDWSRLSPLYAPGGQSPDPGGTSSTGSSESDLSADGSSHTHKVVLLGERRVGKSALASVFGGLKESFVGDLDNAEDTYQRTISVDGQDSTLVVYDIWEQDDASGWMQDSCLTLGDAYIIVFSLTERASLQRAGELRDRLRGHRPFEDIPIILVGNKTDLVRSREVTLEDAQLQAATFDCKYIETSAALHHNTRELFEGVVRQLRLRRGNGARAREGRAGGGQRRQSVTERARRFLRGLVSGGTRGFFRQRSKSCNDLTVL